jgi:hypothetical protein
MPDDNVGFRGSVSRRYEDITDSMIGKNLGSSTLDKIHRSVPRVDCTKNHCDKIDSTMR